MPIVQHPALGRVAFPDGMPLEAIKQAIVAHLGKQVAPEDKGIIGSAAQAMGLPTSQPEAEAMGAEMNPLQHPSNFLGPMAPMMRGFGQNVGSRLSNMAQESYDAGQNIANGQPVSQNVGKAGLSGLQALFSMIPGVGENANTMGMQVAQGNNSGATGTMLGTLLPMAIPAMAEKLSPTSRQTLPTPVAKLAELRPFEKPFLRQADVPQALKDHITAGGGEYKGAMEGTNLLFFNDLQTKSTLAMPSYLIENPEAVSNHMRMSRLEFEHMAKKAAAGK